jgi:hypothetical protein
MRKTLLNIAALSVIFIGSIAVVINRYSEEQVIQTQSTIGIIPAAIITLIVIGALSYIAANFKGMIYKQAFGTFSVALYGITAAAISWLGYLWVKIIQDAAKTNLDKFIETTDYHAETFTLLLGVVVIGLAISLIEPLIYLSKKIK